MPSVPTQHVVVSSPSGLTEKPSITLIDGYFLSSQHSALDHSVHGHLIIFKVAQKHQNTVLDVKRCIGQK